MLDDLGEAARRLEFGQTSGRPVEQFKPLLPCEEAALQSVCSQLRRLAAFEDVTCDFVRRDGDIGVHAECRGELGDQRCRNDAAEERLPLIGGKSPYLDMVVRQLVPDGQQQAGHEIDRARADLAGQFLRLGTPESGEGFDISLLP